LSLVQPAKRDSATIANNMRFFMKKSFLRTGSS
jgi:hypothetical protein